LKREVSVKKDTAKGSVFRWTASFSGGCDTMRQLLPNLGNGNFTTVSGTWGVGFDYYRVATFRVFATEVLPWK
jgi:hypothetical protein